MKKILIGFICGMALLSGCGSDDAEDDFVTPTEKKEKKEAELKELIQFQDSYADDTPVVELETTKGNIVIVLFPKQAPKAVENFTTHAKNGYYDGLTFHRVINDFMIQGGDPLGTGSGGESIWGEPFEDEFSNELYNFRGALSMANSGANTNGSQIFIVQAKSVGKKSTSTSELVQEKYNEVGGTPWLDGVHTVFGQTIAGLDVVDAITAAGDSDIQSITKANVMTYGEYKAR